MFLLYQSQGWQLVYYNTQPYLMCTADRTIFDLNRAHDQRTDTNHQQDPQLHTLTHGMVDH
jgi:hypothetical protein